MPDQPDPHSLPPGAAAGLELSPVQEQRLIALLADELATGWIPTAEDLRAGLATLARLDELARRRDEEPDGL